MHYLNRHVHRNWLLDQVEKVLAAFKSEDVFITKTARQLLWGYQDPLLALLKNVLPSIDDTVGANQMFY